MAKKERKKPTSTAGKIWYFIWYDDSILSWLVNIILAFVLIKFIVYPVLGLILGTSFPIVAVVSNSMEHNGNFDNWWVSQKVFYENIDISAEEFQSYSFKNGFNKGDIMVLFGTNPENIEIGDTIVFRAKNKAYPIIHRVIKIKDIGGETYFETKGDHNVAQIKTPDLDETFISVDAYIGKSILRIPWLGYLKIGFVEAFGLFA